jgi:hypothetical protein
LTPPFNWEAAGFVPLKIFTIERAAWRRTGRQPVAACARHADELVQKHEPG